MVKTFYEVEVSTSSIKINELEYEECYQDHLDHDGWDCQGGGVNCYYCCTREGAKAILAVYIFDQTKMLDKAVDKYLG